MKAQRIELKVRTIIFFVHSFSFIFRIFVVFIDLLRFVFSWLHLFWLAPESELRTAMSIDLLFNTISLPEWQTQYYWVLQLKYGHHHHSFMLRASYCVLLSYSSAPGVISMVHSFNFIFEGVMLKQQLQSLNTDSFVRGPVAATSRPPYIVCPIKTCSEKNENK